VAPVFVELDWATASPLRPDWATGDRTTVAAPPSPPLALAVPMLAPPAADGEPPPAVFVADPPGPATGVAAPPAPPAPPIAVALMVFVALPLAPDLELDDELAPELAWLVAWAVAVTGPLPPELACGCALALAVVPAAWPGVVVPVDVVPAGCAVVVVVPDVVVVDWAMAGPAPRNTRTVHSPAPTMVLSSDTPPRDAAARAVDARDVVRGAT
jgi:hypothetical protein